MNFLTKHKILREFLPLILAIFFVGILFFSPLIKIPQYSKDQLETFADDPMSRTTFIGYSIKAQALENKSFLPILGSSELEHFDAFHPSVYASKYHKKWIPFLAGQPGTQSLTQFFYVSSVAHEIRNRKVIFIISPQWFKPQGIPVAALENFVSKGEVYSWLDAAQPKSLATKKLAQRLLRIPDFSDDFLIKSCLLSFKDQNQLDWAQRFAIIGAKRLWRREDILFSFLSTKFGQHGSEIKKIHSLKKQLPKYPNSKKLEKLAYYLGKKAANNNPWEINNQLWIKYKSLLLSEKGSKGRISYLSSPEWGDFQELLNEFAQNHVDVEFVIQPVNGKWDSEYADFPYKTFKNFSVKVKQQLRQQGFDHIVDLTDKYFDPYYSGDTIHFGTRGWLAVDNSIDQFMAQKNGTHYHINNQKFLSNKWQMN